MRVSRPKLIEELASVTAGLGMKEECLQSGAFIFKNGVLSTFNEETACRRPTLVSDMECAVSAPQLLSLLNQMKEDEIQLECNGKHFIVKGKNKEAGVRMEKEIENPVESVDSPEKFTKLDPVFLEAVGKVQGSASEDTSQFNLTCVNITPEWVEACDNWQLTRCRLDTKFPESILVKQKSIKHIVGLGVSSFCMTKAFVHFKRKDGLIVSCRKYVESYPELSKFLKVKGTRWLIPKGLKEAAEKGKIFCGDNSNSSRFELSIKPGRVLIEAHGESGYYKQANKIEYDGEKFKFRISPKMLIELVDNHNEVLLSPEKIKVNGNGFEFVAALEPPESKKEVVEDGDTREEAEEEE